ncbi:PDDEXK nuclease domain-containing protein [Uliginosibacterium sediminicola]|uniref:PDDEXK nuclease domain-containing protein n=1 Tax=Uliginosibacterium sediminicola TaxID=2024550 RepID=A0ABU9Z1E0_9RHOO
MPKTTPPAAPSGFFDEVRSILREARSTAYAAANTAMVDAYWRIGRRIVEEEQGGAARAEYGSQLIRNLARALGEEFGKGLSVANLKNFRQFYLTFPEAGKGYALRSELSWTHWRLVMRVDHPQARAYYIEECARQQWSSRMLERAIETCSYQRLLADPAPSAPAGRPPKSGPTPHQLLKDPYILEFLDLPEAHTPSERQLEGALVTRLRDFLMELGKGFSFVGRQYRISTESSHFYVDLVFYNYLLKCFVLIDLKTKKLSHGDIGQMDMYVRMFDDLKRGEGDNPTLGIILCADKDETLVRYSVLSESQQLFASRYRLVLPSEEELQAELERRHILDWPAQDEGSES